MYNRFMQSDDWSKFEGLIESGEIRDYKVIMDNDGWWVEPKEMTDEERDNLFEEGHSIQGDGPYGVDLLEALLEHLDIEMEWV